MKTVGDRYFDEEVGQRLRAARLKAGWSQSKVASLLGVTFQQIQKYETGTNRMPANKYHKLATAIGFDVTDLLLGHMDASERVSLKQDADALLRIFFKLNDEAREELMSLALAIESNTGAA